MEIFAQVPQQDHADAKEQQTTQRIDTTAENAVDMELGEGAFDHHNGKKQQGDAQNGIGDISKRSWLFLILSGLATGASWLCYYKALQMGEASKVVPIDKLSIVITMILAAAILHEQFTLKSILGCGLIAAGTLLMVL